MSTTANVRRMQPQSPRRVRRTTSRPFVAVLRSTSILLFFGIWYAATLLNAHVFKAFNPILLPPPEAVVQAGVEMIRSGELQRDVWASLTRVVEGFLVAAFAAVLVGTLVGRSRLFEHLVEPAIEMLRPIPPLA